MKKMNHKAWSVMLLICIAYLPFTLHAGEARSCGQFSAKTLNKKADPYSKIIEKAAKKYDVDAALIKSVIASESCFREMVTSCKGAAGLMQLMPATAEDLGVFDIYDPKENIDAGTRYLARLLKRYDGSVTHAIAAYNAGEGRIERDAPVTITFKETRGYITNVLTALTKLESPQPTNADGYGKAQLLLADWQYAEEVYHAALRGEVLPPTRPTETTPDAMQPQLMLAMLQQPTNTQASTPAATLLPTSVGASPTAGNAQLMSATLLTETPMPVQTEVQAATQIAAPVGLADCQHLPKSLTRHTQQQGSGRYSAFFYTVRNAETLQQVADKLGLNAVTILMLNNLPIGDNATENSLDLGERLKVAECLR
ncbi:MAG: hypothetical protein RI964_467 [Pseudomonadota bacterium]|jgi:hypothetical protein